ncbi:MAG TPA: UdgX family uracil-DNA binding protein [Pseudonocardia sp.]|jgi:DNA polymerase
MTENPAGSEGLDDARSDASECTRCPLHRDASQTVFGAGPARAWLMVVGEQPGDQEDRAGEPFVGPAGRLLDRALDQAGIVREDVYLTNAVKHFKFERRGRRRIHQKPTVAEIRACRPWLDTEVRLVRPRLLATLGATASQALLGPSFRITRHRGEVLDFSTPGSGTLSVVPTAHPSSVLRTPPERRDEAFDALVADLRVVASHGPGGRAEPG